VIAAAVVLFMVFVSFEKRLRMQAKQ